MDEMNNELGKILKEKDDMEWHYKKHIDEINSLNIMLKNKLCSKIDEITKLKGDLRSLKLLKMQKLKLKTKQIIDKPKMRISEIGHKKHNSEFSIESLLNNRF